LACDINDPLNVPLCTSGDLDTFSGRDAWRDETAWNYEVGAKTLLMNGKGTLNVSAFSMDISNMQLTVTAGSCSSRLIFNVPETRTAGMEVEITANPNEQLDLSLSTSFNNAQLRSTLTSTSSTGARLRRREPASQRAKIPGVGGGDLPVAIPAGDVGLSERIVQLRRFPLHAD
jgi:outer membrane receptor protein involved in Fe transport